MTVFIKKAVLVSATAGAVAAIIGALLIQLPRHRARDSIIEFEVARTKLLERLGGGEMETRKLIDKAVERGFITRAKSLEDIKPIVEIENLRTEVNDLKHMTLGLRQAINPENPEEILTIARLSDQVKTTKERFDRLEHDLDKKYGEFVAIVTRELDRVGNSTILIVVALIPLLLGWGFTAWKSWKSVG